MGTILLIIILFLFFKALPYVLLIWISYLIHKDDPPLTPEELKKEKEDWEWFGFFQ